MENQKKMEEKIDGVFIQTMQEMAFIDLAQVSAPQSPEKEKVTVRLEVLMPYMGDLIVVFDKQMAQEFANNVFGVEDSKKVVGSITDAAAEFMNVIIGKLFAALAPELLFELGLPILINDPSQIDFSPYLRHHYVSPDGKSVDFYFRSERLISAFSAV